MNIRFKQIIGAAEKTRWNAFVPKLDELRTKSIFKGNAAVYRSAEQVEEAIPIHRRHVLTGRAYDNQLTTVIVSSDHGRL